MFNLVQLNAPDPEREGHNHMRVRRPARGALFPLRPLFREGTRDRGSRDVELGGTESRESLLRIAGAASCNG